MRELHYQRAGKLAWAERADPELVEPTDALVRPFIASRCDGDTVPLHRPVSRAMQLGIAVRAIDPVVACICGRVPFRGPFAIGHECVAQVVAIGEDVSGLAVGQTVVVPWAVSCGRCDRCRAGLTSKCATTTNSELAAFGLGPASGPWGGMVSDLLRCRSLSTCSCPSPTASRLPAWRRQATTSLTPGARSSVRCASAPVAASWSSEAAPRASA